MVEIVAIVREVKSERVFDYGTSESRVRDTFTAVWQDDANQFNHPAITMLNDDKLKLGDAIRLVALPISKLEYDQAIQAIVEAKEKKQKV